MYKQIVEKSCQLPGSLAMGAIRLYQYLISPWIGHRCRFIPSCSHYSHEAFKRFGFIKGLSLTLRRLCSCHPFHAGGYDPVPSHTKETGDS